MRMLAGGVLYWCESNAGTINALRLDGSGNQVLNLQGLDMARIVHLHGNTLYIGTHAYPG